MGKILVSRDEVYVEEAGRPVLVGFQSIVTPHVSVDSVCRGYRVLKQVVAAAADVGGTIPTFIGPITLNWMDLPQVRREWPDYPVVHLGIHPALPCTAVFTTPGPHSKTDIRETRSITSMRNSLGISDQTFDIIAHRMPGWRSRLPPCLDSITIHPHGYTISSPPAGTPMPGPFFQLAQRRNYIDVTLLPGKNLSRFRTYVDIPDFVTRNGIW